MSQLTMDIGPTRPRTEREKLFDSAVEWVAGMIRQGMTYEQAQTSIMGQGGPEQPRLDIRNDRVGAYIEGQFVTSFPLARVWSEAERRAHEGRAG